MHGHATNPAFDGTVLHVFVQSGARAFFSRTTANRNVPQVRVDPTTLPSVFSTNLPLARPGRCHAPLRGLPEEKIRSILAAAAQFRLQRKTLRLQQLSELHGDDEALFQELAGTLGYKENKLPFTLLAQRFPRRTLRAQPDEIEAVLFGVAGFLDSPDLARFEAGTRQYLRVLWDQWWPRRAALERLILPPRTWRLSGTRPLNHPHRRLAALAGIVAWPKLMRWARMIPIRRGNFSRFDASLLFPLRSPPIRHRGDGTRWRDAHYRNSGERMPFHSCESASSGRNTPSCPLASPADGSRLGRRARWRQPASAVPADHGATTGALQIYEDFACKTTPTARNVPSRTDAEMDEENPNKIYRLDS